MKDFPLEAPRRPRPALETPDTLSSPHPLARSPSAGGRGSVLSEHGLVPGEDVGLPLRSSSLAPDPDWWVRVERERRRLADSARARRIARALAPALRRRRRRRHVRPERRARVPREVRERTREPAEPGVRSRDGASAGAASRTSTSTNASARAVHVHAALRRASSRRASGASGHRARGGSYDAGRYYDAGGSGGIDDDPGERVRRFQTRRGGVSGVGQARLRAEGASRRARSRGGELDDLGELLGVPDAEARPRAVARSAQRHAAARASVLVRRGASRALRAVARRSGRGEEGARGGKGELQARVGAVEREEPFRIVLALAVGYASGPFHGGTLLLASKSRLSADAPRVVRGGGEVRGARRHRRGRRGAEASTRIKVLFTSSGGRRFTRSSAAAR